MGNLVNTLKGNSRLVKNVYDIYDFDKSCNFDEKFSQSRIKHSLGFYYQGYCYFQCSIYREVLNISNY